MVHLLRLALQETGRVTKDVKLELWTNYPAQSACGPARSGSNRTRPWPSLWPFRYDIMRRARHRAEQAWAKFCAAKRHMLTVCRQ